MFGKEGASVCALFHLSLENLKTIEYEMQDFRLETDRLERAFLLVCPIPIDYCIRLAFAQ